MRSTRRLAVFFVVATMAVACSGEDPAASDVGDVAATEDSVMDVPQDADVDAPRDAVDAATEVEADVDVDTEVAPDVVDDGVDAEAEVDAVTEVEVDAEVEVPVPESSCTDGTDDDGDGATDCADSDCVPATRCVPAPAAGWSMPGELRTGDTTSPCAAPFDTETYVGHDALTSTAATCTCTCGAPTDIECVSHYVCERTTGCAGLCTASVEGSGCVESPGASATYLPRNGFGALGACGATPATATTEPPTWGLEARLCTASAGAAAGCEGGQVCMPRPEEPAPACVVHEGDVACPAGYGERQVYYGAVSDTRDCTQCDCRFPGGGCSIAVTAYDGPGCTGTETAATSGACYDGDPASYRIEHNAANPVCNAVGGGTPTGSVTAAMPSTVCCTP